MFKVYVMYQEQNQMKRMKQEAMNQLEIYDRQIHEKQKVMDLSLIHIWDAGSVHQAAS